MVRYIYLDVASLFILALLVFSSIYRKMYTRKSSRLLIVVITSCFIASVFDILSCYPDKFGYKSLYAITAIHFLFVNIIPLLYISYIMSLINLDNSPKNKNKFYTLLALPLVALIILLLINPALKHDYSIFYYTKDNVYHRGTLIYSLYLLVFIYIIIGSILMIKFRRFFNKTQVISLLSIFPIITICVIIQTFKSKFLVELFGVTLSLLLIQIVNERQEIIIDKLTGLNSKKSFLDEIKRSYEFNLDYYVILLKINNFNEIFTLFDYEEARLYIKEMSSIYDKHYKDISDYKTFYLDNGIYAMVLKDKDMAKRISQSLINDLAQINKSNTEYRPNPSICIINTPNDFNTFDLFLSFISNYYSKIVFNDKLTFIKDVKENKDFIILSNIDEIINTAIAEDEFEVYYQPIINMKNKSYNSAEALVRLISKKYGFISPGLFIPYAEKADLVTKIDFIVIEKVLSFIASESFKELDLSYIEINLSMVDCMNPNLAPRIIELMEQYKVDPKYVNLEITESYESLDDETSKKNIKDLEQYGIKFSLDDYGTGYSNIERFARYPINIVKIDKSLVDSANQDSMKIVLKNTFKLISELKRKTVVEGVETIEQAQMFEEFGCDYIQGFYFSRPLPLIDFIEFVKTNNKKG
ncbi:MAG: EAL domain-containing protein [Acholeplasmatales bacterium]|nr:EAL domain-containing protein [Acholeplasmatales bacterium]